MTNTYHDIRSRFPEACSTWFNSTVADVKTGGLDNSFNFNWRISTMKDPSNIASHRFVEI